MLADVGYGAFIELLAGVVGVWVVGVDVVGVGVVGVVQRLAGERGPERRARAELRRAAALAVANTRRRRRRCRAHRPHRAEQDGAYFAVRRHLHLNSKKSHVVSIELMLHHQPNKINDLPH